MLQTGGTRDAAQVAFFLVLSFPALLLLVVWAFSALLGDDSVRASIVDAIVSVLPLEEGAARSDVEQLLDEVAAGAGALGWIGVLTLLYSSSGAIGGLRHAVNEAWGESETRPFVPGKALDVGLTLVVAPLAIVALGLTLSGSLADTIGDHPWIVGAASLPSRGCSRWRSSSGCWCCCSASCRRRRGACAPPGPAHWWPWWAGWPCSLG